MSLIPKKKYSITIVGSGYVGMSLAVLLAQNNKVTVYDIDEKRVNRVNSKISPVRDSYIDDFLKNKSLSLEATHNPEHAYGQSDFIIIATPTNYNFNDNSFDTSTVSITIEDILKKNNKALIIVKSTIPVGFTESMRVKFNSDRIIFSPEFLREGHALYDNLYPSRIIIGDNSDKSKIFANLLLEGSDQKNTPIIFMSSKEAEAVKLFANTFLAMRVSFFNELDSFSMEHALDTETIIDSICLDKRIGKGYNNPSLGYGGYCLPKDTKQLLSNYKDIPQTLIEAIVSSNKTRKDFIADKIISKNPNSVGFYRLVMKEGSDNYRDSAVLDIISRILDAGIKVFIFEPTLKKEDDLYALSIEDISFFKKNSEIIIANRKSSALDDVLEKVFTRDIYGIN